MDESPYLFNFRPSASIQWARALVKFVGTGGVMRARGKSHHLSDMNHIAGRCKKWHTAWHFSLRN